MQTEEYSIQLFARDAEAGVRKGRTESEILLSLKPLLERLLKDSKALPDELFKPRPDRFAMNLLYMPEDEAFSIIGGVWQPGQTTPIHDHLTWALIGVYQGEETESIYRRTDDGSDPRVARIEKVSDRTHGKGHVTVLGQRGIHRVSNLSQKPTRSIHVYGRDIGHTERHSYDPVTGEIGTFLSGYCNVLRDLDRY